jgi:predicted nuclease of predicted toxin-antitoxin system
VVRPKPKFLIDEMLAPSLASTLRGKGLIVEHVNDIKPKHKTGKLMSDRQVAQYAIDRGMIVVTRNIVDFLEIYIARDLHPGLVLFHCDEDHQFIKRNQAKMLAAALDAILEDEPIQEAIEVHLLSDDGKVELFRSLLPDPIGLDQAAHDTLATPTDA